MRVAPEACVARDGRAFTVRSASPREAGAVLDHLLRVQEESRHADVHEPSEFHLPVDRLRALLASLEGSDNGFFLVAAAGGEIVATLSCKGGRLRRLRHSAELAVNVRRDWWRQGVGRALLRRAVAEARASGALRRLQLQVFAPNVAAVRLYEACGFVHEGRLAGQVCVDGEDLDVLCMALPL